jgi:hypothetical protein
MLEKRKGPVMSEETSNHNTNIPNSEYKLPLEFHLPESLISRYAPDLAAHKYPVNISLSGKLCKNKVITEALPVVIDFDEGEYIASEPRFHIHGSGPTQTKAIEAFMRIICQIYDDLIEESEHLSKRMQAQLEYLQSKITLTR